MRRPGIATKLIALTVGIVVIAVSLATAVCLGGMQREMVRVATESQEARLRTFWELLRGKGTAFRIVDERLMAGDYVINGNHELPDRLRELCGGTATIFMRDERVSTNVLSPEGARAVGTRLRGPAHDAIFKEGKPYRGVADILGEPYFTAYDPIRDPSGEIVGVIYVGVKTADFLAPFNRLRLTVTGVAALLAAVFGAGIFFFTRRLLAPIHQAIAVTGAVAEGDLTAAIPLGSSDEAGRLLDSVRAMVEALNLMLGKVNLSAERLKRISDGVAEGASDVVRAAGLQQENVSDTSSSIHEIAESAREVGEEARRLSAAAGESSASVLQMAASVEEVAQNAERLASLVEEVTASITQSVVAAREIGSSVRSLADASATTASSVAEMDAAINQVEESARRTASVSSTVVSDAETGRRAVEAMVAGMGEIRNSSHITAEVIETLSSRADDIGVITSVIDDIARQTSLLALNAAIIAAQAG
ncbi:MAG TPA: methyl-accepting chemotaxis protein, partial [Verrucomicrobiae bacterium]|nr:methyl-accepting chemotaxis protein [Verrucomicrobiae bacterium]